MSQTSNTAIAVIGIDIGKNSFHVAGHDARGAIVLRQKWSRCQVEGRLANVAAQAQTTVRASIDRRQ
jgi:transposase